MRSFSTRASKRRGEKAADRFEAESLATHQELGEAYRMLAVAEPARCIMIGDRAQDMLAARYDREPLIHEVAITSCMMMTAEPFFVPTDEPEVMKPPESAWS